MAGYSGTPLANKLGFTKPMDVLDLAAPAEYRAWLGDIKVCAVSGVWSGLKLVIRRGERPA